MAPDVPPEGLMRDPTRMRDDSSNEGSDPARRVARVNKGKSIKQSTGVHQEEEPISYKRFEDLAHAILRVVGSRAPESSLPPVTLEVPPPQTDNQAMVRRGVPEASKPKPRPSGKGSNRGLPRLVFHRLLQFPQQPGYEACKAYPRGSP